MRPLLPLLLLATCHCGPTCEDSFEEYVSHLRARFESCGIDSTGLESATTDNCDDSVQENIECQDDCVSLLSCAALTGTNQAQLDAYVDCISACPTADL